MKHCSGLFALAALVIGCAREQPSANSPFAPLPVTSRPADSREVTFFGVQTNTPRIVYVVDHRAAILEYFSVVQQELRRSVQSLHATHHVSVIFFSGELQVIGGGKELRPATVNNKSLILAGINKMVTLGVGNDEISDRALCDAFTCAFRMEPAPEAIYFLSGHFFHPRVQNTIHELNRDKNVRIHCVAFTNDKDTLNISLLQHIANDNGGIFRFVSLQEADKLSRIGSGVAYPPWPAPILGTTLYERVITESCGVRAAAGTEPSAARPSGRRGTHAAANAAGVW